MTTTPKAKEARGTVERLITFAKKGDLASRRQVLRTLRNKELVKELFEDIAPKYADRPGGYTRVIKVGRRQGDDAPMAIFELVGFEGMQAAKLEKKRQKQENKAVEKEKADKAEAQDDSSKDEK